MLKTHKRNLLQALGIVAIFLGLSFVVSAEHHKKTEQDAQAADEHGISIQNAWARATFAMAKTGAGYFNLTNNGGEDVVLLSASVSETVAGMVELHETVMMNDMMQMRELEAGVPISAGDTVAFEPGGKHIMFMGLTKGLDAGEEFDVVLTFSDDTAKTVKFEVKDAR